MCRRLFAANIRHLFFFVFLLMGTMSIILMTYQSLQLQVRLQYTDETINLIRYAIRDTDNVKEAIVDQSLALPVFNDTHIETSRRETIVINKNDHKIINIMNVRSNTSNSFEIIEKLAQQYFDSGNRILNSFTHPYIVKGTNICPEHLPPPLMLILCLSKPSEIRTRNTIRKTWASIVRTGKWPSDKTKYVNVVKIGFILGRPTTPKAMSWIHKESDYNKDLIVADFDDSYYNLTRKVLVGMRWALEHCSGFRYIVKTDGDTFVHVKNAIKYVKSLKEGNNGLVSGTAIATGVPFRKGKWTVSIPDYPFALFPRYVSGQTYVMSKKLVPLVVNASHYLPYLYLEDVFITGILRVMVGGELIPRNSAFPTHGQKRPKDCTFFNTSIVSATNIVNDAKYEIWESLKEGGKGC